MPSSPPTLTWISTEAGQYLSGLNDPGEDGFLSPLEREKLSALRFTRRSFSWLLGRRAAKALLKGACPELARIPEKAITIANLPSGAPFVQVDGLESFPGCISISHRRNMALAAYCPTPGWRIGIDLELIEGRHESFLLDYFTPSEIAAARACRVDLQPLWITLAWSLKEAMLKALGAGLRVDTRCVEVGLEADIGQTAGGLQPEWHAVPVGSALVPAGGCRAWWQTRGCFVITMAAIAPEGIAQEDLEDVCLRELP